MSVFDLEDFVRESNRIEGILRPPHAAEIDVHRHLLGLDYLSVADLQHFISVIQPNAKLRDRVGLDVRVGSHLPPRGAPEIRTTLEMLLSELRTPGPTSNPYWVHQAYETLHPFMDGNGRSGRALWLHMMGGIEGAPLGFLHHWYYQSLSASRP